MDGGKRRVTITRTEPVATQSGRAKSGRWVVAFVPEDPMRPDPLMGWVSSTDTRQRHRLTFSTKERAIAWVKQQGMAYTVLTTGPGVIKPGSYAFKSYADNFHPKRKQTWTH